MPSTRFDTAAVLPQCDGAPRSIALFLFDLSLTGVARNGVRLANALAEAGHAVHLLVCRSDGREKHDLSPKVNVIAVAETPRRRLPRVMAIALAVPALRRWIAALAPDVLVSLGNHGHLAVLAASAGLSPARVYRISNDLHHPGNGPLSRLFRRASMALLVRSATRLILVSQHLAGDPAFATAAKAGKLRVAVNGVNARKVVRLAQAPSNHRWLDEPTMPAIITVGRLAAQKNHATLLDALALANRESPVRLVILGAGSAEARAALLARADQLGIGDRVALLDPVENPFPFMARASAFVLPSLWEGASNVLLEAIALDLPVVAARTAGNAQDVLGYGRFGLLVDPCDADALARAILLQIGPDACRPGLRAADFDADQATARACNLILEAAPEDRPAPRIRLVAGTALK